jgi:hypothetical protein
MTFNKLDNPSMNNIYLIKIYNSYLILVLLSDKLQKKASGEKDHKILPHSMGTVASK